MPLLRKVAVAVTILINVQNAFGQQNQPVTDTTIHEEAKDMILDNIPIVSLDESDDQDGSAQNISGQLNLGRNPFLNAASFNFNAVRFRMRGYDADQFTTLMNGVNMENLDNGFTPFGLWGGLNDVMRNRTNMYGLQSNNFTLGSLGGSTSIDTRAFRQRKQTSIGYALSNRNYVHRFSYTRSTGMNAKGWAFSFSASRRWADEGFADGTFYDGWSFFTAADKKINDKHMLSFVAFATPTSNGRQGSAVQEMMDIAGTNYYNPFWGYQNGKKRNASVAKTFMPVGILTHEWKINSTTTLLTAGSLTYGERGVTGLDWYNAPDPRPDYYRYLPSYQEDPTMKQQLLDAMRNDVNKRQVNWDALYTANYGSFDIINDVNGIKGNTVVGRRSLYVVEDRVVNTLKYNANTTLNTVINNHISLTSGLTYESQSNNYFKRMNDLLGGDFYLNYNQFAERDFPNNPLAGQNDANKPNGVVKVGDRFGYDYNIEIRKASGWVQTNVKLHGLDFFVGAENSYTNFWRVGNMRSGLFMDNSYGKSEEHPFYNYAFKAGMSIKLARMNYLFVNGRYETRAPYFDNIYLSPRNRDLVQDNLSNERIGSVEAGYVVIAPTVKFRATGYYTNFSNQTNILSFYDDQLRNFVNYALRNIGKKHIGIELGTEVILYKGLNLTAAASIGSYRYKSRQLATITAVNSANLIAKDELIYCDNFRVATPQQAYNIGINYRSPKYWFANLNFNYFEEMWLDFNPVRRTSQAVDGLDPNTLTFNRVVRQERLLPQGTVDLFAGYSWLLNNRFRSLGKRTFLVFTMGVNNLLNNTNIVSGGFEQLRFDFAEKNVDKFPAKKFYAYGINYQASVALRF